MSNSGSFPLICIGNYTIQKVLLTLVRIFYRSAICLMYSIYTFFTKAPESSFDIKDARSFKYVCLICNKSWF